MKYFSGCSRRPFVIKLYYLHCDLNTGWYAELLIVSGLLGKQYLWAWTAERALVVCISAYISECCNTKELPK